MSGIVKVLIADSHPSVRNSIRNILQANPELHIAGEVEDGDQTIIETLDRQPDVLLLDLTLPRLPALEAMRAILDGSPGVHILLINRQIRPQSIVEALQIGAHGIVLQEKLTADLAPAIECIRADGYWLQSSKVNGLVGALHQMMHEQASPDHKTYGLTKRELEVVRLIVDGCSNREIAGQFGLSEETVKRHLSNIFDKLGVSTRLELALFALANHLAIS
jgi:DNA-binding NarL/FixJ family response regulator